MKPIIKLNRSNRPKKWPETYLHIDECMTGEEWIVEIDEHDILDLKILVKEWINVQFWGELELDGDLMKIGGRYYAAIYTDGRSPNSVIVWDSGGFHLKHVENGYSS